jgi:O-antigen/teichoic acid export membrane protein
LTLGLVAARAGARHLRSATHFWLLSVASTVNQQAVVVVLASFSGPMPVALFATHRTLAGIVGYIGRIVEAPLRPELTFLHAAGRTRELQRAALLSSKVVSLLSSLVAIAAWFLLPQVYSLWTGRQLVVSPALLAVLLVQAALMAGWSAAAWPLLASNQHHRVAYFSVLNAIVTVILAAALAPALETWHAGRSSTQDWPPGTLGIR